MSEERPDPRTVHVLPVNDLIVHKALGEDCPCGPTVTVVADDERLEYGRLITHRSLDRRTAQERLAEIKARAAAASEGPWEAHICGGATDGTGTSICEPGTHANGVWSQPDQRDIVRDETGQFTTADAVLVAHARTDVPDLVAALEAVLDVHQPVDIEPSETICKGCSTKISTAFYEPTVEWPCPTVQAISTALDGDK